MEKLNKVFIVGELTNVDTRTGETNGNNYIAGSFTVKVKFADKVSDIELKYFVSEFTKAGAKNKNYASYQGLPQLLNQRIRVTGDIRPRMFYSTKDGQVINFTEVNAGFFQLAKDSEADTATFEYSGFVKTPLFERKNEKEEVVAYEIEIAQANYNESNMGIVKFRVPKDPNIRAAIENSYRKGATVSIQGQIFYLVEHVTKTEEVAFGTPITKEFTNTTKILLITGGKDPIMNELAYTPEQINMLEAAYATEIERVEKEAKSDNSKGKAVSGDTPNKSANTNRMLF